MTKFQKRKTKDNLCIGMRLAGKKIIVGVTGSIAAYKTASLIRLLVTQGAEVKVVMTPLAKEFITPLTLATVSRNPILVDFFNPENGEWNSHVSLGEWADAFLIAPATANTIAKMAYGIADNLLLTTYLSARCPIFIAPAMDLDMYAHATTTSNLKKLVENGAHLIEPGNGFLASGLQGKGRMAEPEDICQYICSFFEEAPKPLLGKRALVTVGGSIEKIDAVRYISNNSTGKMGYALSQVLVQYGAEVTIVRARVDENLVGSVKGAKEIVALSAEEMYREVVGRTSENDIIIMAAAVADFTPQTTATHKIKKSEGMTLELKATKDIAAEVGKIKNDSQTLIGFALESCNEVDNAIDKLHRKNMDYIVLNSLNDSGAGFGYDTNKVTLFAKEGSAINLGLKDKKKIAKEIIDNIFRHKNR
ncbi:MAG: bifunctional phosphopantothenoylcysteine decarboxylase/phosphopantothenate--cysteine ligase CoaBC [Rikenellaceae bacterium]